MHYLLLLIAAAKMSKEREFVLGHACERKINDLAHSLNNSSKSTGLVQKRIPEIEE
jgi:hypothetical protein